MYPLYSRSSPRQGAITNGNKLKDAFRGSYLLDPAILGPMAEGVRPKAPGMKYKHIMPKGRSDLSRACNVADAGENR